MYYLSHVYYIQRRGAAAGGVNICTGVIYIIYVNYIIYIIYIIYHIYYIYHICYIYVLYITRTLYTKTRSRSSKCEYVHCCYIYIIYMYYISHVYYIQGCGSAAGGANICTGVIYVVMLNILYILCMLYI